MEAWANLCRGCLSSETNVSLLDNTQDVNTKFFDITTVEVKEDDGLPQKLCSKCYSVLVKAYQFREQCIKMNKSLKVQFNNILTESINDEDEQMNDVSDDINDPLKQLEKIIKSEPADNDDDCYYVVVIDNQKEINVEEQIKKIKTENTCNTPCQNKETNNEEECQRDSSFSNSVESYLLQNSKISESVPATILENEESQYPGVNFQTVHMDKALSSQDLPPSLPQMIEVQGSVESENAYNEPTTSNIIKQFPKNKNLIKILSSSGNEQTIMLKSDDGQYLSNSQLISIEGGDNMSQEGVIFCEGVNDSNFQVLSCEGSELVIEYADDSQITTVLEQEDGTLLCDCGQKFQCLADYEKHQHNNLCTLCGKSFETSEMLIGHMLLHSVRGQVIACPICNLLIKRNLLGQHIKYNHNMKPRCDICCKTFATEHNLKRHMMIHGEVKEFECDVCFRRFHQKITMQTHRLTHIHPFMCNKCEKTFEDKETLIAHQNLDECDKSKEAKIKEELIKTVKQEVMTNLGKIIGYACSLCKKTFSIESVLEEHIENTHLDFSSSSRETNTYSKTKNLKRFKCKLCMKNCSSQAMLIMHERVHTNERPFPCQLCDLKFKTKTHLRTHQLTHTREKKFGCSVCMKFFALKGNLVVHLRTHTGERPYVCTLCGDAFIDSKYLKKHKLKKHSMENVVFNNI